MTVFLLLFLLAVASTLFLAYCAGVAPFLDAHRWVADRRERKSVARQTPDGFLWGTKHRGCCPSCGIWGDEDE